MRYSIKKKQNKRNTKKNVEKYKGGQPRDFNNVESKRFKSHKSKNTIVDPEKSIFINENVTGYNYIELEHKPILPYLRENIDNVVFYFNKKFYLTKKTTLSTLCKDENLVKYPCKTNNGSVAKSNYSEKTPILSGKTFGCPCGSFLLSNLKSLINNEKIRIVKVIDDSNLKIKSTVSLQAVGPTPNFIGASHCQEGQDDIASILYEINIPDLSEPYSSILLVFNETIPPRPIPPVTSRSSSLILPGTPDGSPPPLPIRTRSPSTPNESPTVRTRSPRSPDGPPPPI